MIIEKNRKIFSWYQAATWFFVLIISGSFLFSSPLFAYTGDYNKTVNGTLSAPEWNNLINDFVSYRTNGNVGIGTTNPVTVLDIFKNGSNAELRITGGWSADSAILTLRGNGNSNSWSLTAAPASSLIFSNANTGVRPLTLLNSGSVGIGTTSPTSKFQVYGASGSAIDVSGGRITGLDLTPLVNTDAVPLGYLQANYSPTANSFWGGQLTGNAYNLNTGNVGIGSTTPETKLHVFGDLKVNGSAFINKQHFADNIYSHTNGTLISTNITVSDNQMIELYIEGNSYSTWGAVGGKVTAYNYTGNNTIVGTSYVTDGYAPSEVRVFHHNGVVKFWLPTSTAQTYRFRLATSFGAGGFKITSMTNEAMPTENVSNQVIIIPKTVINNNVGIGTNLPGSLLDIGMRGQNDSLRVGWNTANMVQVGFNGSPFIQGYDSSPSNHLLINPNGGNVGIGTTTPSAKLDVLGTVNFSPSTSTGGLNVPAPVAGYGTIFNLYGAGDGYSYSSFNLSNNKDLSVTATKNWAFAFRTADDRLALYHNTSNQSSGGSTELFSFLPSGNLGIGTTTPNAKLQIAGSGIVLNVSGNRIGGLDLTPLNPDEAVPLGYLQANYASVASSFWVGSSTGHIYSSNIGNVGIGTSNPGSKLTLFGGDFEMENNKSIKVNSSTSDTTLLLGNYADGQGFGYGTSTARKVSLAVEGDVKANRFCIGEDCKDTWQQIVYAGGGGNAVYVGMTAKVTGNNNGVSGYREAARLCNEVVEGSHVCTPDDMLNTIALNSLMPSENVWVFTGPPGYTAVANDCDGRSTNSNSAALGAFWEVTNPAFPNGGRGLTSPCGASLKLSCCK